MNTSTPRNPIGSVTLSSSVQDRSARKEMSLKIMNEMPIPSSRHIAAISRNLSKPGSDLYNKASQENCKCRSCQSKRLAPIQQSRPKSKCGLTNDSFDGDLTDYKEEYHKLLFEKKETIEVISEYFKTNAEEQADKSGNLKNMVNWIVNDANKWKNQFSKYKKSEEETEISSKLAAQAMESLKTEQEKSKKVEEKLRIETKGRKDADEKLEKLNSSISGYINQLLVLFSIRVESAVNLNEKFMIIIQSAEELKKVAEDGSIASKESGQEIMKRLSQYEVEVSNSKELLNKKNKEIGTLESEIKLKNQSIDQLMKEKSDYEITHTNSTDKDNIIFELQEKQKCLEIEKEDMSKNCKLISREFEELKKKYDAFENDHFQEHVIFENAQNEIKSLKSKLDLIMMSVDSLTSERDSAQRQVDTSKKESRKNQEYIAQITAQLEYLQQESRLQLAKKETDDYLSKELAKLREGLSKNENSLYGKATQIESLLRENESLKSDLKMYQVMNEKLQDELAKMQEGGDEDTFENVMRHELAMMRESYEKKIKDLKDVMEAQKKKAWLEIKQLKEDLKNAEYSREMAELRLKSFASRPLNM